MKAEAGSVVALLKACAHRKDLKETNRILADRIQGHGGLLLRADVCIGSALVNAYARCGDLPKAREVFDDLQIRDVVTWNALISGYTRHERGDEAFRCFDRMQNEGHAPSSVSYLCILKACGSSRQLSAMKGEAVHARMLRQGIAADNVCIGNALIDMYAKRRAVAKAHRAFCELPARDVVSWNVLISGYAHHGYGEEALACYDWMKRDGYAPSAFTFVSALKACGSVRAIAEGDAIHAEIIRAGPSVATNVVVGTALVDMYAKCDAIAKAQDVFDQLPVRNVVSWNALIAGYVRQGLAEEALKCFECMRCTEGFHPNAATFASAVKACGLMGVAEKCIRIHKAIVNGGLSECVKLGNALVDMYARCGMLPEAKEVFEELKVRDVVAWTSLISGYAQLGEADIVVELLESMIGGGEEEEEEEEEGEEDEGVKPSLLTFTAVLSACSHGGLVEKGLVYFHAMRNGYGYGFAPAVEHQTCMIDLLGKAGCFGWALAFVERMSMPDSMQAWTTLLGACRICGHVELGKMAFEHAVELDKRYTSAYICMWSIYVAAGMHADAMEIEAMRLRNGGGEEEALHDAGLCEAWSKA
jgi:pentatricopeptide repeat protein